MPVLLMEKAYTRLRGHGLWITSPVIPTGNFSSIFTEAKTAVSLTFQRRISLVQGELSTVKMPYARGQASGVTARFLLYLYRTDRQYPAGAGRRSDGRDRFQSRYTGGHPTSVAPGGAVLYLGAALCTLPATVRDARAASCHHRQPFRDSSVPDQKDIWFFT